MLGRVLHLYDLSILQLTTHVSTLRGSPLNECDSSLVGSGLVRSFGARSLD